MNETLLEIAKPIALLLCICALFAVFYTIFMVPAGVMEQRSHDALLLLVLSAGICMTSGMIFREPDDSGMSSLLRTLPVQLFVWAVVCMLILFLVSQYLENYFIFYKDPRQV